MKLAAGTSVRDGVGLEARLERAVLLLLEEPVDDAVPLAMFDVPVLIDGSLAGADLDVLDANVKLPDADVDSPIGPTVVDSTVTEAAVEFTAPDAELTGDVLLLWSFEVGSGVPENPLALDEGLGVMAAVPFGCPAAVGANVPEMDVEFPKAVPGLVETVALPGIPGEVPIVGITVESSTPDPLGMMVPAVPVI